LDRTVGGDVDDQVLCFGEAQADDLAAELDGERVAEGRSTDELQDHPREQTQGHQTLIHPALGIERSQLPELAG
jgi:hypothetical protein